MIRTLAFAPDGMLYAGFFDLYTINPATAATMATVGSFGSFGLYLGTLTFDSNGTLYGMDSNPSTHIYSINLATGVATAILATGSSGLYSLVAEQTGASRSIAGSRAIGARGSSLNEPISTLVELERQYKAAQDSLIRGRK
jgi:hypothetical protein